jgi:hypothetical protein
VYFVTASLGVRRLSAPGHDAGVPKAAIFDPDGTILGTETPEFVS